MLTLSPHLEEVRRRAADRAGARRSGTGPVAYGAVFCLTVPVSMKSGARSGILLSGVVWLAGIGVCRRGFPRV